MTFAEAIAFIEADLIKEGCVESYPLYVAPAYPPLRWTAGSGLTPNTPVLTGRIDVHVAGGHDWRRPRPEDAKAVAAFVAEIRKDNTEKVERRRKAAELAAAKDAEAVEVLVAAGLVRR